MIASLERFAYSSFAMQEREGRQSYVLRQSYGRDGVPEPLNCDVCGRSASEVMGDFRGYLCGSCDEELALDYAFESDEPESEPVSQAHTPQRDGGRLPSHDFRDGIPINPTEFTQVLDSPWDIEVYDLWRHLGPTQRDASVDLICFAYDTETLCRPCVDCGLKTGYFCDGAELEGGNACIASDRIPAETWCDGQRTPFCRPCEDKIVSCNFCRGTPWCQPFTRQR